MTEADLGELLTEQRNPASEGFDALPTLEMLRVMNAEDRQVAEAVEAELPHIARAADLIAAALGRGGRLFYIGAGTSGRLGVLDASECRPTFNVPQETVQGIIAGGEAALSRATEASEDDAAAGARDLAARGFRAGDVLVGITASGRTPYVLGAVAAARALGCPTIAVVCSPGSPLAAACDIAIAPLTGPEVVTGSTRLKAGSATKMVLNMLSTAAMVRLGLVYSNLMVNVQPRNVKLADRAARIIREVAGVTRAEAVAALAAAGSDVRIAILIARLELTREQAEVRLAAAGGRLREALRVL